MEEIHRKIRELQQQGGIDVKNMAKDIGQFIQTKRTPRESIQFMRDMVYKHSYTEEQIAQQFTLSSATEFVKDLEDEKVNINVCDLNNHSAILRLVDTKFFDKQSSSDTVVRFSNLTAKLVKGRFKIPVSLKIFQNNTKWPEKSLFYEYKLYKLITDLIIKPNICPNFIPYIAFGCCDTNVPDLQNCYLITEKAGNGMQFGKNKQFPIQPVRTLYATLSSREKQQVLFQIVYALTVMQRYEISHNDLHDYNVLVMIMDEPVILRYIVDSKMYSINTKYIPYIYDWDHGMQSNLGHNEKIDSYFVDELNIGTEFNPIRDIYTFFCYLGKIGTENPQSVRSYTNHPASRAKETGQRYAITDAQFRLLGGYTKPNRRIFINGVPKDIYKLSASEYNSFFAPLKAPPNTKDIFFYTKHDDQFFTYYIYIWNPFTCRITNTGTTFQTPEKMLETFGMFVTTKPVDTSFVYRLPTREEAKEQLKQYGDENDKQT